MRSDLLAAFLGTAIVCIAPAVAASPTTFTYQGHLAQDGTPAEGAHEFEVRLLDGLGAQIGATYTASAVVTAGAFAMELDFGNAAFDGTERYLEISVRSVVDGGAYVVLSPNQLVTSTPVAQFALNGNEGPQGPAGVQGDQGVQGNQGNPGADGSDGVAGAQGPQGDPGNDGAVGAQGPQGNQGDPGNSPWTLSGAGIYYSSGRVGIGTTSPVFPLQVISPSVTAIYGRSSNTSGGDSGVYGRSDGLTGNGVYGRTFSPTGVNVAIRGLTNSPDGYAGYFEGGRNYFEGNVGIGTNNPGHSLEIVSSEIEAMRVETDRFGGKSIWAEAPESGIGVFGNASQSSVTGTGVLGWTSSNWSDSSGVAGVSSVTGSKAVSASAYANTGVSYAFSAFVVSPDGYAGYFAGGRNYFSGNVGMGTNSPSYALEVRSPTDTAVYALTTSATGSGVYARTDSTSGNGVYGRAVNTSGNSVAVRGKTNSASGYAGYFEGGRNYFQGNVGIGDTTPDVPLDVVGDALVSGVLTVGTTSPQTTFDLAVSGTAAKTGGGSWSVFSDQRLKKNITSMTGSLDTISALRPVNFEYKAEDHFSYTPGVQFGFIAQEVQQVIPQWVNTADDGYFYLDQVGYEALIVDAIQELRAEKDAEILKKDQQILELQIRLDRLERMMTLSIDR